MGLGSPSIWTLGWAIYKELVKDLPGGGGCNLLRLEDGVAVSG